MCTSHKMLVDYLLDRTRGMRLARLRREGSRRYVLRPPLCVNGSPIAHAPSVGRSLKEFDVLNMWETFIYGFLVTDELVQEGNTIMSWLTEQSPSTAQYLRMFNTSDQGLNRAIPLLLYTLHRRRAKTSLVVGEGEIVVGGLEYEIGVRDGRILGKYSAGTPINISTETLTERLPGRMALRSQEAQMMYHALCHDDGCMEALSYLVFCDKEEVLANNIKARLGIRLDKKPDSCLMERPKPPAPKPSLREEVTRVEKLPPSDEVRDMLFDSQHPIVDLYETLVPECMGPQIFRCIFGNKKSVVRDNYSQAIRLAGKYQDLIDGLYDYLYKDKDSHVTDWN